MDQPNIVSDWAPADKTRNHLEVALTDKLITNGGHQQQVLALRDSFDEDRLIYVTPGQVHAFSRSASTEDSPAGRLLAAAGQGTASR